MNDSVSSNNSSSFVDISAEIIKLSLASMEINQKSEQKKKVSNGPHFHNVLDIDGTRNKILQFSSLRSVFFFNLIYFKRRKKKLCRTLVTPIFRILT